MIDISNGWDVSNLVMHSAFDELQQANEITKVNIKVNEIEPQECFFIGGEIRQRRSASRKHLVKATALFQVGMESLINYWLSKYPEIQGGGNFVKKWEKAFEAKGMIANFDDYASFYRSVRIAVIHPENQDRIDIINNINFMQVYQGIKHGWEASERLANELGEPYDNNSWKTMCNIHGVPFQPLESEYQNLEVLSKELYSRHLSELNKDINA